MQNSININSIIDTTQKVNSSNKIKKYVISFLALLVVGVVSVLYYSSLSSKDEVINSYIELRIIDKSGFSLPGVNVYINNNLLGVSDAFGEIHSNIDVVKNSDLTIHVVKTSSKLNKNFSLKVDETKNITKTLQI